MDLTVIVPTYCEAGNIGRLVRELSGSLAGVAHEVLVVDDNSPDGTAAEARAAGARVEVRTTERGLATAVVHGLERARGTFAAVMDADFQHPVDTIGRMHAKAVEAGADLVVASRYLPGASDGAFGPVRRSISAGAAAMARLALPPVRHHRVTDPMSGLFLVRRDRVDPQALRPQGYKVLLEILARCPLRRVAEVGYSFAKRERGASKLGAAVLLQYVAHLAALGLAHPENQRMLRFVLVGASGVVVNLVALWLLHGVLGLHDLAAVAIAVEASVLSNFILNDRFTFHDRRTGHVLRRLLQFHIVSFLTIGINVGVYSFLTRGLGWHYLAAESIAIVAAFGGNYLGNIHWTYGRTPRVVPGARALAPYVPLMIVVAGAGVLYMHQLDAIDEVYFDEHFYLSVARQIDNGVWEDPCWVGQQIDHRPLNFEHPPLAKLIMAWSVAEFDTDHHVFEGCRAPDCGEGEDNCAGKQRYDEFTHRMKTHGNPYAWRGPSAVMGTLAVLFAGLATARIFRDPWAGAIASFLVATDGMVLTSSRIALLDIFAAGFVAAAVWAATFPTRRGIIGAGLLLGAGFACKFTAAFAGPAILLLSLWSHHRAGKLTRRRFDFGVVALPMLPLLVWLGAMAPWLRMWDRQGGAVYMLRHLKDVTWEALRWGATAKQEHPYESPPWQWLTMERPIFYFSQAAEGGLHRYVWAFGNPVLWWGACAAVLGAFALAGWRWAKGRPSPGAVALAVAAVIPASTYAAFFLLQRDQFIFYMTLVVPLMAIPLAGALGMAQKRGPIGVVAVAVVVLGALAAFVHYYPVHMAIPIDQARYDAIRSVVPWMHW